MNHRGFTLMEVMMVVVIMAIMMAIATPALSTWRENAQNREVAREILAGLRQARSLAITENRQVEVRINPSDRQLIIAGVTRNLPGNASLETIGRSGETVINDWNSSAEISTIFLGQGSCSDVLRVRVNENPALVVEIDSRASGLARMN